MSSTYLEETWFARIRLCAGHQLVKVRAAAAQGRPKGGRLLTLEDDLGVGGLAERNNLGHLPLVTRGALAIPDRGHLPRSDQHEAVVGVERGGRQLLLNGLGGQPRRAPHLE